MNEGRITYLTGVSCEATRETDRADLGLLATPAGGVYAQRDRYPVWAADNAMFAAPRPTGDGHERPVFGAPVHCDTATAREVRYGATPPHIEKWWAWVQRIDTDGLFVTLPDVVGDYKATWELAAQWITRVRGLGHKVAVVLQNGVEHDQFIWRSILLGADAIFLGGGPECVPCNWVRPGDDRTKVCPHCGEKLTEWKLGDAAALLVAYAKDQGLHVHMGRVNSRKRLQYALDIGCDTADGTYIGFGPTTNAPKVIDVWLPAVNGAPELVLAA